ncbi:MAG: hypothetical protein LUF29_02015 [Oscillospiraceae bacterium]|nr:hypothetical protein [Oscillospiraceae bacterium]
MKIERINNYADERYSESVLRQHGAFLVDGEPFGFEIISTDSAVVHMSGNECPKGLTDEFRFYAEHITKFYREDGTLIIEYPPVSLFKVSIKDIQPSQFLIDKNKVKAVASFVHKPEDIVIPLVKCGNKFISADGHTRLALAVKLKFSYVYGFTTKSDEYINFYAYDAMNRGCNSPYDLRIISHDRYEVEWIKYCKNLWEDFNAEYSGRSRS